MTDTSDKTARSSTSASYLSLSPAQGHFAELNRFSISGQFTTFHQAAIYSGRRF